MSSKWDLKWKFSGYVERKVLVVSKDVERRELAIIDFERKISFIVDVPPHIRLERINEGKTYKVKLSVYTAKMTEKMKRDLERVAERDPIIRNALETFRRMGGRDTIYRFVLVDIRDYYFDIAKKRFETNIDRLLSMKERGKLYFTI